MLGLFRLASLVLVLVTLLGRRAEADVTAGDYSMVVNTAPEVDQAASDLLSGVWGDLNTEWPRVTWPYYQFCFGTIDDPKKKGGAIATTGREWRSDGTWYWKVWFNIEYIYTKLGYDWVPPDGPTPPPLPPQPPPGELGPVMWWLIEHELTQHMLEDMGPHDGAPKPKSTCPERAQQAATLPKLCEDICTAVQGGADQETLCKWYNTWASGLRKAKKRCKRKGYTGNPDPDNPEDPPFPPDSALGPCLCDDMELCSGDK